MRVSTRCPWICRIDATLAMNVILPLGLGVVRLEFRIADRPRWRNTAMVSHVAEVSLAHAEQRGAVPLRVAADVVTRMRMKRLDGLVAPDFLRVVLRLPDNDCGIPLVLLALHVVAPLDEKNPFAGWREFVS